MDKRVVLSLLVDFYGPLITEHRLKILRLYLDEDMSYQEIAEQMGISRQGVHDAVKRAAQQLESYEDALGLARRYQRVYKEVARCRGWLERVAPEPGSEAALAAAKASLEQIESIEG